MSTSGNPLTVLQIWFRVQPMYIEDAGICHCTDCSCEYFVDPVELDSYEQCPPLSEEEWAVMEKEYNG